MNKYQKNFNLINFFSVTNCVQPDTGIEKKFKSFTYVHVLNKKYQAYGAKSKLSSFSIGFALLFPNQLTALWTYHALILDIPSSKQCFFNS